MKLAQSEREEAWQEMAKQVAHEIKNPLTPMRLTVQSFQRKFDANDSNLKQKINEKRAARIAVKLAREKEEVPSKMKQATRDFLEKRKRKKGDNNEQK